MSSMSKLFFCRVKAPYIAKKRENDFTRFLSRRSPSGDHITLIMALPALGWAVAVAAIGAMVAIFTGMCPITFPDHCISLPALPFPCKSALAC